MREYQGAAFNMQIAILTEEGLPSLFTSSNLLGNRQMYIFPDCHPMIAITVGDAMKAAVKS